MDGRKERRTEAESSRVGWCTDGRGITSRGPLRSHVQVPLLHPHPAARHWPHLNQEQTQAHHTGSQSAPVLRSRTDSRVHCEGVRVQETYSREVGAPVIPEQLRRLRSSVMTTSPRLTVTLTSRPSTKNNNNIIGNR